ncbi:MAG: hypothetical protein GYA55_04040, partial [SAR324 cluster bacterium]|nr:hypothetical protein [SAR324 cluster bacterium]
MDGDSKFTRMSIRIGSNIPSLQAQRLLDTNTNKLRSAYERLSSGLRINHASDDSGGLALASGLNLN